MPSAGGCRGDVLDRRAAHHEQRTVGDKVLEGRAFKVEFGAIFVRQSDVRRAYARRGADPLQELKSY